jgi:hypothetical protein
VGAQIVVLTLLWPNGQSEKHGVEQESVLFIPFCVVTWNRFVKWVNILQDTTNAMPHTVNSLVDTRNWWLILLSEIWMFFQFSLTWIKNSNKPESVSGFSVCWVINIFHSIKVVRHILKLFFHLWPLLLTLLHSETRHLR